MSNSGDLAKLQRTACGFGAAEVLGAGLGARLQEGGAAGWHGGARGDLAAQAHVRAAPGLVHQANLRSTKLRAWDTRAQDKARTRTRSHRKKHAIYTA